MAKWGIYATYSSIMFVLEYIFLPYIVYWMLCGFFWLAFGILPSSELQQYPCSFGLTAKRFEQPISWKQWAENFKQGYMENNVVSFSGLLDGANYSIYVLYNIANAALSMGLWIAGKLALGTVSELQKNDTTETAAEFLAKSVEGGIILAAAMVGNYAVLNTFNWAKTVFKNFAGDNESAASAPETRHQIIQQQIQEQQRLFMIQMEEANDDNTWAEWVGSSVSHIFSDDFIITFVVKCMVTFILLPLFIGRFAVFVMSRYSTVLTFGDSHTLKLMSEVIETIVWIELPSLLKQFVEYIGIEIVILMTPIVMHISKLFDIANPLEWAHDSIISLVKSMALEKVHKLIIQVDSGSNIYSRQFTIILGYACIITVIIQCFNFAPKQFHGHRCYLTLKHAAYTLFTIIAVICDYLSNIAVGYTFRLLLVPILSKNSAYKLFDSMFTNPWTTIALNMMLGMIVTIVHNLQFRVLCLFHRPGLPWSIVINENIADKIQSAVRNNKVLGSIRRIFTSVLILALCGLFGMSAPLAAIAKLVPGLFPITLDGFSLSVNVYTMNLFICACLAYMALYTHINYSVFKLCTYIQLQLAHIFRLSEYVLGERSIVDEGTWTIKGIPWLSVPVAYLWMPNGTINDTFASIPFEYRNDNTKIQEAIDLALADKYPYLSFTLDGTIYKVPWTNAVKKTPGVSIEKRVDSRDDCTDEEDYHVVYMPLDRLEKRSMFGFVSIVTFQAQLLCLLAMALVIGRCIWIVDGIQGNKPAAFYFGLILIMAFATTAGAFMARFGDGFNQIFARLHKIVLSTCSMVAISLAFFTVVPLLVGKVSRLYLSTIYTYYYAGGDSLPDQQVAHFWEMTNINLIDLLASAILVAVIRALTSGEDVVDEMLDVFDHSLDEIKIWATVKILALPVVAPALALCVLPYALVVKDMSRANTLTVEACQLVLEFKDISLLAKNCRIIVFAAAIALFVYVIIRLFRTTHSTVRNRMVRDNQQLVNYNE